MTLTASRNVMLVIRSTVIFNLCEHQNISVADDMESRHSASFSVTDPSRYWVAGVTYMGALRIPHVVDFPYAANLNFIQIVNAKEHVLNRG